jgi:hypothetical protein
MKKVSKYPLPRKGPGNALYGGPPRLPLGAVWFSPYREEKASMKPEKTTGVRFEERPRIANRSDALELLDILITASFVENLFFALDALRDALEREII